MILVFLSELPGKYNRQLCSANVLVGPSFFQNMECMVFTKFDSLLLKAQRLRFIF